MVCYPLAANRLLNYVFELLSEHLNVTEPATAGGRVEAIDGNVKPVSFFPFHHEVSKTCGIGFVVRIPRWPKELWQHQQGTGWISVEMLDCRRKRSKKIFQLIS